MYMLGKGYCSKNQLTEHVFQSSHSELNGFSLKSYTKPHQQLPSTTSLHSLNSSKTPTNENHTASFSLIKTEKPSHKCSDHGNATNIHLVTKHIISENSEIQAGILALESLLKVNSKLKNKDIVTKSSDK